MKFFLIEHLYVLLQVRLLDFVDFGPIQLPSTVPRIKVWKGNLIKVFSQMFMGTNGKYGAYPVSSYLLFWYKLS